MNEETCGALDCESTEDVVECHYDDGTLSFPIKACLPCRERLERAGLLVVSRAQDRPNLRRSNDEA